MKKSIIFKGLFIKKDYLIDSNIKYNDKFVIAFIEHMQKYIPGELITNDIIAFNLNISVSTVSSSLKRLEDNNYIKTKKIYHKNKNIVLGKEITILK